jgi:uridine phosphorylase
MKPIFILANEGDVSDKVVVAGDPGKVTALSKLLEKPILVNYPPINGVGFP